MALDIHITDNSRAVLSELNSKKEALLNAWGMTAERYAKRDCPVNTGRMRNGITYAIKGSQSPANTESGEQAKPEDYEKKAEPEKDTVYIGGNVHYLAANELRDMSHRSGKAHFIRDAIANHQPEYKSIAEAALK